MKATWVLLMVCLAGCGGGSDGFDPSSVTCTDTSIAAVIRLDFFSLEPKGYALFTGDGEPVTVAEAVAIAEAAPADYYAGNEYEVVDGNPADGDVAVLLDDPGDFGGQAIVDLRTGTLLFKAGVVWGGRGRSTPRRPGRPRMGWGTSRRAHPNLLCWKRSRSPFCGGKTRPATPKPTTP
ncbi:MAG: hypothetical protein ABIK09_03980 [Pseudomonadota bacterium]